MKLAGRRRFFYPIRAVISILMAFAFLLTGCGEEPTPPVGDDPSHEGETPDGPATVDRPKSWEDFEVKEFYSQMFDGYGNCSALRCHTNVLDTDNVTISFHFGTDRSDSLEKLSSGYYKRVDIYFRVYDANEQPAYRLIAQLNGTDERLLSCRCCAKEHVTKDEHNSNWFSYTVPKELTLLGKEIGTMGVYAVGIKQVPGQEEQEELLARKGLFYRIHDNKVYLGKDNPSREFPEE